MLLRRVYGYHFCRNTNSNRIVGNVFCNDGICSNGNIIPDSDTSYYLCTARQYDIITYTWYARCSYANRYTLKYKTILSYYDYERTPDRREILDALSRCESHGADLSKIAVTAKTKRDLLNLWSGTVEMEDRSGVRPRIVVAMGPLGNISRILPSFFGSVLTYASGITTSMEGQINANDLRTILSLI